MVFLTESWFWRGTQSAIFYYASCTPWVEYKHNRKLRKEAAKARQEKDNSLIYTQPGVIRQPDPFQTNEEWTQEIVQGPGPPKGWKGDSIYYKYARKLQREDDGDLQLRPRGTTGTSTESPAKSVFTGISDTSTAVESPHEALGARPCAEINTTESDIPNSSQHHGGEKSVGVRDLSSADPEAASSGRTIERNEAHVLQPSASRETETTSSKRSSLESISTANRASVPPRPSLDKRLSTAMDGFKETMRAALHPEHWNWIRYDRDDEILSNINERMKGMWGNVKGHIAFPLEEQTSKLPQPAEAASMEDEVKKWQRGTHPAVNDLSPPIVSQLPSTREEAQWMLLPPASADVMLGRARPDVFDDINRKPLCVMGRPVPDTHSISINNAHQHQPSAGNSDDDEAESIVSEDDLPAGWAHLQKPQRAYLYKRRASYGFDTPLN